MDSGLIPTLTSPTRVNRTLESSALPMVDDMSQGKVKPEIVENPVEVSSIRSPMPCILPPQRSSGNSI